MRQRHRVIFVYTERQTPKKGLIQLDLFELKAHHCRYIAVFGFEYAIIYARIPFVLRHRGRHAMTMWSGEEAPRIWRVGESPFSDDEIMSAPECFSETRLRRIAASGFNAVWLRGRLRQLMRSTKLPELNDPEADLRRQNIKWLIERAAGHGLGVYLFFNEPLALPADDPFWNQHPDFKGQLHEEGPADDRRLMASLCVSHPQVQAFFDEVTAELLTEITGLAGVILITASEHHSHCWSHYARFSLDDGYVIDSREPMGCERCRDREPAELVGQLAGTWVKAAAQASPCPRVLAWNWSWSMWYAEPQAEVIEALPAEAELLVDWERGGTRPWFDRQIMVDEYALSYAGPSQRFERSWERARQRGLPVHAKLQLGTTHELATVPNLPVIPTLHRKCTGLNAHEINGFMGCWNFGCMPTLNTFAIGLFASDPRKYESERVFFHDLIARYFGEADEQAIVSAWRDFCEALTHYPFSIRTLYKSPINYAVAFPLTSRYEDAPLARSWVKDRWGDRLEEFLGPFTLEEMTRGFEAMVPHWRRGLEAYRAALSSSEGADQEQAAHRHEELSCAEMIHLHFQAMVNLLQFHQWRKAKLEALALSPPCEVPLDDSARMIIQRHIDVARAALPLASADARLGYHQEPQAYLYDRAMLEAAIEQMQQQIAEG